MTELTFLLELILNHKLPLATKNLIKDRIGQIQAEQPQRTAPAVSSPIRLPTQTESVPVQAVAHTAAAAQALAERERLIQNALNPKPEPGRTGPRKF